MLLVFLASPATAEERVPDLVPYEGRGEFSPYPLEQPLISATPAGALAKGTRSDIPLAAAAVESGMVVADVGCGHGRYSVELARSAGKGGKLYAVDIFPLALEKAEERLDRAGVKNALIVQSSEDDVNLPAAAIDLALMSDAYFYVVLGQQETKEAFLASFLEAMKPGGIVVITYTAWGSLNFDGSWQPVAEATVSDFVGAGFEAGRRYAIEDPNSKKPHPSLVFEFRKPATSAAAG
jgi:precorrin-6B methylase 2